MSATNNSNIGDASFVIIVAIGFMSKDENPPTPQRTHLGEFKLYKT